MSLIVNARSQPDLDLLFYINATKSILDRCIRYSKYACMSYPVRCSALLA